MPVMGMIMFWANEAAPNFPNKTESWSSGQEHLQSFTNWMGNCSGPPNESPLHCKLQTVKQSRSSPEKPYITPAVLFFFVFLIFSLILHHWALYTPMEPLQPTLNIPKP